MFSSSRSAMFYALLSAAVISAFYSSWQVPQSCQGYLAVSVDVGHCLKIEPGFDSPDFWRQRGERGLERGYTEETFLHHLSSVG